MPVKRLLFLSFSLILIPIFVVIITKVLADAPVSTVWDFSNSQNYIVSDSGKIEISGSSALLKVQEYISDANTGALFHLNESAGNEVTDSSTYNVSGSGYNISWNPTAKMNGGVVLNGYNSFLSFPDSSPTSLTQSMTLEAWVKPSSEFHANHGSGDYGRAMGVIDKGNYQLYFDDKTGKLTYEISPNNADSWTQVAGPVLFPAVNGASVNNSWDQNGKASISAITGSGNFVFVGLGSAQSDAEVWKWDGTIWTKIGGDGTGVSPSQYGWTDALYEDVTSLVFDGRYLYAGLGSTAGDAEVWRWDSNTEEWTKIGGDGTGTSPSGSGWSLTAPGPYEQVGSLIYSGSYLYAGLGNSTNDAEVWRWDPDAAQWLKIGGDGINSGWLASGTSQYEMVYSLTSDGNYVYAGLGNSTADAEVWRWDPNATAWSRWGGDGINSSWGASGSSPNEMVQSMLASGTALYVGLGVTAGDAEVWKYTYATSSWSKIGGDGTGATPSALGWSDTTYERVYGFAIAGTGLYAGLGDSNADGEVWSYDGSNWTKRGGDGTNSSWNNNVYQAVKSIYSDGSTIYAGVSKSISNVAGNGEIWTYSLGGSWSKIGGNGINYSWGFGGINSVETMITSGSNFYAGTGYTSQPNVGIGNAMVWEYNGLSNWRMIGGQGINSGWAAETYEQVTSLVSHAGYLYAGLGLSTGDAEIWKWSGTAWNKMGGDGTGWGSAGTSIFEGVFSMLSDGNYLYAGLGGIGTSAAGDALVYRYNGSDWTKIGGNAGVGVTSPTNGWANVTYERVNSLAVFRGDVVAGLGDGNGDGEVWKYTLATSSWSRIGGDTTGVAGTTSPTLGWDSSTYNAVDAMAVYKNELYVGLGRDAGEAEVWKYNGSTWTKVGGDGTGVSPSTFGWLDATYERVRNLVVYNGELYASLGISAGDGEVWKYDGSQWTKVGGDSLNNGWTNIVENVATMGVFQGKLYAGNGDTADSDATIWAYGNNSVLKSVTSSWTADWYHIAATYDGSVMKLFVNGTLENSASASEITLANNSNDLLIGTTYGTEDRNTDQGYFLGNIDEVRISNTARTSFNYLPYTTESQTVSGSAAGWGLGVGGIGSYLGFLADDTGPGTITYRISNDSGATWKYWNNGTSQWETSSSLTNSNTKADINSHISTFDITNYGIKWQAILTGDGNQQVKLGSVTIQGDSDLENPTPPTSITILSSAGGSAINPESYPDPDTSPSHDIWFSYSAPQFNFSGADDTGGAGIAGYWIYFGSEPSADPVLTGAFYSATGPSYSFTPTNLISGTDYYLIVKTQDKAQRVSAAYEPLIYRYDNQPPQNPSLVSVSPSGYSGTNTYTFFWPNAGVGAASDCSIGRCAGIQGFQYKTSSTQPGDPFGDWSTVTTDTTVTLDNVAYKENANTFYLRTIDKAGNVNSSPLQTLFYYAGSAPTAPQNLVISPESSNVNSFSVSWSQPATFAGDASKITYCYTVNTTPTVDTCTFTSAGATSLAADAFANQPGDNKFYLAAKDEVGNINYDSYAMAIFKANTAAPGIPVNLEIADVSVKSTSSWKLAVSWEAPVSSGSGLTYKIYRSTDGTNYSFEASTTGIAFVSTGLDQETYYYKVRACDDTNNCGPMSDDVSMLPTGRFTSAPSLTADPEVTDITTKKATVSWSTERDADSKVQYGTSSDNYFDEEPSNSDQVTEHEIKLNNLDPGKRYFLVVKWTDEDGNTGVSDEINFRTTPAPTVTDPKIKVSGIDSVVLSYTVKTASKVRIYYGKTSSFGGIYDLSTSTDETTYETTLSGLEDGTKYYYKINTFDSEDSEYEGNILSFETLPRPKISTVRIQQVKNTAQPSVLVSWDTNTEVSSIISYYPSNNPGAAKDEVNVQLLKGTHRMIIRNLQPETPYSLLVKGRDKAGNEASSEIQNFTTSTDTRPPMINDLNIEGGVVPIQGGQGKSAQLIVTWNTDEEGTSQVEFGEGTGGSYSQKTQEDSNSTLNHLVVLSNLVPSKVYHLRVISKDKAGNEGKSVDTVTITPKATDNALDLVISNLREAFGFLKGIK